MFVPMQELFIKICGITNLEDADLAGSLGANAIGFNFTKSSNWYITPELASSISKKLPEYISKIGVFEEDKHRYIQSILKLIPLSAVQLQGSYAPDDLVGYETSVIKAFSIDRLFDVEVLRNYLVDAFLLGGKSGDQTNFKPREYSWDIALKAKEYGRIILSGGLNPENIEDAVRFVQPYGVDVCSGIETILGKKDPKKMQDFIAHARSVSISDSTELEDF
jgi:phosphoribosylanthranilate isomerase